jgi:hypothetical protein
MDGRRSLNVLVYESSVKLFLAKPQLFGEELVAAVVFCPPERWLCMKLVETFCAWYRLIIINFSKDLSIYCL